MTDANKKEIGLLIEQFIEQYPSQAQAIAHLKNVSEATIIQMRKGRWESIKDEMWRNVGKQLGWNNNGGWSLAETMDFKTLVTYLSDAKDYGNVFAIVGDAGSGKSATAEWYSKVKSHVYHITCAEFWNRKMFLGALLQKMGKENTGLNIGEMMELIVETLLKQDKPLIVLDEADKLSDQVLYFFITLYNMCEGKCGIVMMATEFLMKRIKRGHKLNKKGYAEILSRIGRRFITLHGTNKQEVKEICEANGITEPIEIAEVYNQCENDLRRVKRMVHKMQISSKAKSAA